MLQKLLAPCTAFHFSQCNLEPCEAQHNGCLELKSCFVEELWGWTARLERLRLTVMCDGCCAATQPTEIGGYLLQQIGLLTFSTVIHEWNRRTGGHCVLLDIRVFDTYMYSGVLDTVTQQKDKLALDMGRGVEQRQSFLHINDVESKTQEHEVLCNMLSMI